MRNYWRTKLTGWMKKRIPGAREHSLSHKKIFILPSRFGVFYLVLCALLFVLGTNYQNNLMRLLCTFLLALFLLHMLTSYVNFSRLRIKALRIKPTNAGKQGSAPILISSQNRQAQGILHFSWWQSALLDTHTATLDSASVRTAVPFTYATRGLYTLPRLTIRSDFPLGLFKCWTHLDLQQQVTVYPQPLGNDVRLFDHASNAQNETTTQVGGRDDFHSLRTYNTSDALSNVAWKRVAKTDDWLVKTFEEPVSSSGWVTWASANASDKEKRISQLAYQIVSLTERKQHFGLTLPGILVQPDCSQQHMHHCLTALATYPSHVNSIEAE